MLKPLSDHIVVKSLDETKVTDKGIIVPDTVNKEKPEKGEVIAVGPGKLNEAGNRVAPEVKVGDKIVFTKYAPNEVKINNETYLVLSESDILAIIE